MARWFVVVSGLPASGKSTVAELISGPLGLATLDKDDFLELLFPDRPITTAARHKLSRHADEQLRRAADQTDGAVLVSWWRRPGSDSPAGTPTDWLGALGPLVELHCACTPRLAAERFLARKRHRSHGDDRWRDVDEIALRFADRSRSGPLGVGPLVTVDTTAPVDVNEVVSMIRWARPP